MEKRTIIWKNAENSFNDFPLLDENEMRNITCGIYQLKLAFYEITPISYTVPSVRIMPSIT
jgi:hypothetical protein